MDNKQNQPNSDSTSSSAANKPSNSTTGATGATPDAAGTAASTPQAASSPKPAGKAPQGAADTAASTAESSQPQAQNGDAQRKSWLNQEELLKGVNQLPQSLKDLGSKALEQVNSLSSTQKVVGGALLVSGLSWLALRSKNTKGSAGASAPYIPKTSKKESKWKSSNESVYRGTSSGLHDAGTENGF